MSTPTRRRRRPLNKSKIVFRCSRDHAAKLENLLKFKARVVACGYRELLAHDAMQESADRAEHRQERGLVHEQHRRGQRVPQGAAREAVVHVPADGLDCGSQDQGSTGVQPVRSEGRWPAVVQTRFSRERAIAARSTTPACTSSPAPFCVCSSTTSLAITGNRASEVQRLKDVIASQVKKLKDLGELSA